MPPAPEPAQDLVVAERAAGEVGSAARARGRGVRLGGWLRARVRHRSGSGQSLDRRRAFPGNAVSYRTSRRKRNESGTVTAMPACYRPRLRGRLGRIPPSTPTASPDGVAMRLLPLAILLACRPRPGPGRDPHCRREEGDRRRRQGRRQGNDRPQALARGPRGGEVRVGHRRRLHRAARQTQESARSTPSTPTKCTEKGFSGAQGRCRTSASSCSPSPISTRRGCNAIGQYKELRYLGLVDAGLTDTNSPGSRS